MVGRVERLVDELFDAFERADWDAVGKCFAAGGTIATRFGPGASAAEAQPWDQAKAALSETVRTFGIPKYTNRRKTCTADGFIEQHTTALVAPGAKEPTLLSACLIGRIDPSTGLVATLEEYLDPGPLTRAVKKAKGSRAKGRKGAAQPVQPVHQPPEEGFVVVVTGASSGIGQGIALECASRGSRLLLTARREGKLQAVADACLKAGAKAVELVVGDGRDASVAERILQTARQRFGRVDRLYVNAGISQSVRFMEAPVSVIRDIIETNLFAGVYVTRALLPMLLHSKGKIAVITSAQARLPAPKNTGYSASKHAQHGFFESLRLEVEDKGVTVTMVMPGPVNTEILDNLRGPGGETVRLDLSASAKQNMTTAAEAGRISVDACEASAREVVFPKDVESLVKLRLADPVKADQIIKRLYDRMSAAKL